MQIPNTFNRMGISQDGGGGGGMPTSGLTFYQSFSASTTVPEIGDEMLVDGNAPTLATVEGIKCAHFNGGGVYKTNTSYWNTYHSTLTFSFWCKTDPSQFITDANIIPMAGGHWSPRAAFEFIFSQYNADYRYPLIAVLNYQYPTPNNYHIDEEWHHYCAVLRGYAYNVQIYVDGVYITDEPNSTSLNVYNNLGFGSNFSDSNIFGRDGYSESYIAGARVYDRALTLEEIQTLATEYTPKKEMPTSGLVFYAPLSSTVDQYAETGQAFTYRTNTLSAATVEGLTAVHFTGDSNEGVYTTDMSNLPSGNNDFTMCCWIRSASVSSNRDIFSFGEYLNDKVAFLGTFYNDKFKFGYWAFDIADGDNNGYWHFVLQKNESGVLKTYVDGEQINAYSHTADISLDDGRICIGAYWQGSKFDPVFNGYITATRIYDRALTDAEIKTLSEEFTPDGEIIAEDLTFSLYQKEETYGITYQSAYAPTFEIISGSLPSTISFNTSTGEFTGKGPTDADHTYNLTVRITAAHSIPAEVDVTIYTYMTARIYFPDQSFTFISNKHESQVFTFEADEFVWTTIVSGSLPSGIIMYDQSFQLTSDQTSASTTDVIVKMWSTHNQDGVSATLTVNVEMNQIICNDQTFNFYSNQGSESKPVAYSATPNSITDAVFTLSGTLPNGVTFDSTNGTFTSDGTQTADETAIVNVTVSSSNGTSTAATGQMTLNIHAGAQPLPTSGLVFYAPLSSVAQYADTGQALTYTGDYEATTLSGMKCLCLSSYTQIGTSDVTGMPTGRHSFTMSIWEKLDDWTTTDEPFFWFGTTAAYQSPNMGVRNSTYFFNLFANDWEPSTPLPNNDWNHIVFVVDVDNDIKEAYINGVSIGSRSVGGLNIQYGEISVSDYRCAGVKYYAAARIYDRALSPTEINALYHEFDSEVDPIVPNGLTFFQPFKSSYITPQIGNDLTLSGNAPVLENIDGIDCATLDTGTILYDLSADYWPTPSSSNCPPFTVSFWFNPHEEVDKIVFSIGERNGSEYNINMHEAYNGGNPTLNVTYEGHYYCWMDTYNVDTWYHIAFTVVNENPMGDKLYAYMNGVKYPGQHRTDRRLTQKFIGIGCQSLDDNIEDESFNFSIAGLRIYDRVLTDAEIGLLSAEFTPLPTSGLVMYHPLASYTLTPEIGDAFTLYGNTPSATIEDNIPCLHFTSGALFQSNVDYWQTNPSGLTFSVWVKCENTVSDSSIGVFGLGNWSYCNGFELMLTDDDLKIACSNYSYTGEIHNNTNIYAWHHIVGIIDDSYIKYYFDGSLVDTSDVGTLSMQVDAVSIGANNDDTPEPPRDKWFDGWLAGARIYDRALTDAEIATLATEFTPTT